jgi:tRNA threonylcarbamoyladenosine biosynthesis protein TsaB
MMRVLAIDTSTRLANVALLRQKGETICTVAAVEAPMTGSHAVHLIHLIDRAMAESGWNKKDLDAFVAVRGPGSFTGVRIALGTAQGLALASDRPCVGVNTLEAMAQASGRCPRERTPALGAGRNELYVARYDAASSPPTELAAPRLQAAGSFWDAPPGYILWGEGAEPPHELASDVGRRAGLQTAAAAGRIAILRGIPETDDTTLSPLYVRLSDAELKKPR